MKDQELTSEHYFEASLTHDQESAKSALAPAHPVPPGEQDPQPGDGDGTPGTDR